MGIKKEEILEELSSIFLNKTFDAILPPLVYAVINSIFGLLPAVILAVLTALSRIMVGVHYPSDVLGAWVIVLMLHFLGIKIWI